MSLLKAEFNAFCAALAGTTFVQQWGGAQVWKVGGKVGTAKAQGMLLQNGYVEVENFGSWAVFKDIK